MMRSLMLNPDVILLDEPMGALDPLVRYDLQEDLKRIFSSLHKTVILVTHDLGEAGFLGDQIVLLGHGRIIRARLCHMDRRGCDSEAVRLFAERDQHAVIAREPDSQCDAIAAR